MKEDPLFLHVNPTLQSHSKLSDIVLAYTETTSNAKLNTYLYGVYQRFRFRLGISSKNIIFGPLLITFEVSYIYFTESSGKLSLSHKKTLCQVKFVQTSRTRGRKQQKGGTKKTKSIVNKWIHSYVTLVSVSEKCDKL